MDTALSSLLPNVQEAATRALDDLKAKGIPYAVTSTLRTTAEQQALYAQGREPLLAVNAKRDTAGLPHIGNADNSYKVTNCDGIRISSGGSGRSPHQLGIALDVVPLGAHGPEWPGPADPRWAQIAEAFKAQGFTWGGDWKGFQDLPHYQWDK